LHSSTPKTLQIPKRRKIRRRESSGLIAIKKIMKNPHA
jgi:hypothetical protein